MVTSVSVKEIFKAYLCILVPLGLLVWIAFSFPLIFVNGSYIISVISDPFGWGWNLFGTTNFRWQPLLPEYLCYVQYILLMIGLGFAIDRGYGIGFKLFKSQKAALNGSIPMVCFAALVTLAFMVFFIG